jgi:hypothetical protein
LGLLPHPAPLPEGEGELWKVEADGKTRVSLVTPSTTTADTAAMTASASAAMTATASATAVGQGRRGAGSWRRMVGRAAGMAACASRSMLATVAMTAAVPMVIAAAKRCHVVAGSPAAIVDTEGIVIAGTGVTSVIVAVSAVGHDAAC